MIEQIGTSSGTTMVIKDTQFHVQTRTTRNWSQHRYVGNLLMAYPPLPLSFHNNQHLGFFVKYCYSLFWSLNCSVLLSCYFYLFFNK